MNELGTFVIWLMFGACVAMIAGMLRDLLWVWPKQDGKVPFARFRRQPKDLDMSHLSSKPSPKPSFCGSCGARKIVYRMQLGFNTATGKPAYNDELACPDWNEATWTANRNATISRGLSYGLHDYDPPKDCVNRVFVARAPMIVHTGHADGDVSVDCKRCIIDMERAGIISHDDADTRLKEIA